MKKDTTKSNLKHTNHGVLLMDKCEACGHVSNWYLISVNEEFRILGKKLFNTNTSYALMCSECGYGTKLTKDIFETLKKHAVKRAKNLETTPIHSLVA